MEAVRASRLVTVRFGCWVRDVRCWRGVAGPPLHGTLHERAAAARARAHAFHGRAAPGGSRAAHGRRRVLWGWPPLEPPLRAGEGQGGPFGAPSGRGGRRGREGIDLGGGRAHRSTWPNAPSTLPLNPPPKPSPRNSPPTPHRPLGPRSWCPAPASASAAAARAPRGRPSAPICRVPSGRRGRCGPAPPPHGTHARRCRAACFPPHRHARCMGRGAPRASWGWASRRDVSPGLLCLPHIMVAPLWPSLPDVSTAHCCQNCKPATMHHALTPRRRPDGLSPCHPPRRRAACPPTPGPSCCSCWPPAS
jgi:hypothetical protein